MSAAQADDFQMKYVHHIKGFFGVAITMSGTTAAFTIADMVIRITAGCIAIAVGLATLAYWLDRRKYQRKLYNEKLNVWRRAGMSQAQIEMLKDRKKLLDTQPIKLDSTKL